MSERFAFFVVGVLAGLLVNVLMDAVKRWRENETERKQLRAYLHLIQCELNDRSLLLKKYVNTYDSHNVTWEGAEQLDNDPQYFQKTLENMRGVFDAYPDILLLLPERVGRELANHYLGSVAQFNSQKASRALPSIQEDTGKLLAFLAETENTLGPRTFFTWLPVWLRGAS